MVAACASPDDPSTSEGRDWVRVSVVFAASGDPDGHVADAVISVLDGHEISGYDLLLISDRYEVNLETGITRAVADEIGPELRQIPGVSEVQVWKIRFE